MKSIPFLFLSLFISTAAFGQMTYGEEELDAELEEQMMADEQVISGENELPPPSEIERQEDVLHPEGENYDWSLGNEELPVEDIE